MFLFDPCARSRRVAKMSNTITYTVHVKDDKAGDRLDKVLADALEGVSRARVQALIAGGQVHCVGEAPVGAAIKVRSGEVWEVQVPSPAPAAPKPMAIPLEVVYEDDHLIVVDKPAGMVVHPAAGHVDDTLVNALLHHCRGSLSGIGGVTRPGIVHRLDKDTSGLLVAAKNDVAHQGLAEQFADHSIERSYLAMVWGRPLNRSGTIEGQIGRSPRNRKKMTVLRSGGKFARTHYRVLDSVNDLISLVECRLETGRTHQIRVHMSSIGHSVVGDSVYGATRKIPTTTPQVIRDELADVTSLNLHARHLGFTHPVTLRSLAFSSRNIVKTLKMLNRFNPQDHPYSRV